MDYLAGLTTQIENLFAWAPAWLTITVLYSVIIGFALAAHRVLYRFLRRAAAGQDLFWRSLVGRTETLALIAFLALALALATNLAPLDAQGTVIAGQVLAVCVIGLAALAMRTALHIWMTLHLRRFRLDSEDNVLARKHVTQVRILRRVADTLIIVIAIAAMLMSFDGVRQYGVSLLASAGAAGIVAGLALQPLLKNIFAGIQLAITQPIRIDDVLVVEGEWARVEEITSTYVVVRTWDLRRLILPLSYFIEEPFENWTREGANLLGAVILYLDYQAPMDKIRTKVREIIEASPLWDKELVKVQVTGCELSTMKVRIVFSARNSSDAFDLRCLIREETISFLQKEYPQALPKSRTIVEGTSDEVDVMAAAGRAAFESGQ